MNDRTATPRHPNTLHALSTAWALRQARQHLDTAVQVEARALAAEADALSAADGLRSSQWSTGRSRGGHGDPVGSAALARFAPSVRPGRLAELAASTTSTLTWLADTLRAVAGPEPLWRLINDLPAMQPGTAANVHRWLADHDQRIRAALGLDRAERDLDAAECPSCGIRPLCVHTAAPDPADWVVTCGEGCRCSGVGCGCGMLVQVEGAVHVWDRGTPAIAAMLERVMLEGPRTEGVAA